MGAVRRATEALGLASRPITSGAGHDAVYVSRVAPTGMIFIPCEDGISHNEIEAAAPADIAAGCDVLINAMVEVANQGRGRQHLRLPPVGAVGADSAAGRHLLTPRDDPWRTE